MLKECRQLVNGVVLHSDISDCGYTVRGVYQQLTT